MSNNELLLEISNLLDTKLEAMREEVKEENRALEHKIERLGYKIEQVDNKVEHLSNKIEQVDNKVERLDNNVQRLDDEVSNINITIENMVIPRLTGIEECYTSTFDRYKVATTEIESLKADNKIIKSVLEEHSKKLNAVSM